MTSVFVLQHLHHLPSGEDSVFLIGIYQTETAARSAVSRLSTKPGFCKHPNLVDPENIDNDEGFHVDRYELDQDHWTEGFVTTVGDQDYQE